MTETSTNPQSWKQKYTSNKPLRKTKEQVYVGISVKWFKIAIMWSFVSVLLAVPMVALHSWLWIAILVLVQTIWWGIFALFFRSCEKFDETMLTIKFMIAGLQNKHEICKFDMDLGELRTYIPVVEIFKGGLIQYTRGRFGVLIKYNPPTDPGDKMEAHLLDIQAIINRLSGDMQVTFISSSRFGMKSPILRKLEKMILDGARPKKHIIIIKSIYDKIVGGKTTPDWAFYVSLGLGSHATVEEAMEMLVSEVPGFIDGLENAHLNPVLVTDRMEIIKTFIQFMVPRDF